MNRTLIDYRNPFLSLVSSCCTDQRPRSRGPASLSYSSQHHPL